jgi:hypothetical protein
VPREQLEHKEPRELPVFKEPLAYKELLVPREQLEHKEPRELPVFKEPMERKEPRA